MYGSSKGNQVKYCKNNLWYKGDYLGYEGAAECVVSRILEYSNVQDFVKYEPCTFEYGGRLLTGCRSENFLQKGEEEITLENLIQLYTGGSSYNFLEGLDAKEKIQKTVDLVQETTGIPNFGEYLTVLLELDKLTLNEDRHFHNIVLLRNESGFYRCSPIFDNGAALLSDTSLDYPLSMPYLNAIRSVKAKPFFTSFTKQVRTCEGLFGVQLRLKSSIDIEKLVQGLLEFYAEDIVNRIRSVLVFQLERNLDVVCGNTADDILSKIQDL